MVYYSAFRSGKPVRDDDLAELCNGSTADSDSVCEGSNPSPAAKKGFLIGESSFFDIQMDPSLR